MEMQKIAQPYEDLLRVVMDNGTAKGDRTGTGTRSLFGETIRYDLSKGFPAITSKKVHTKAVIYELLFFLRGESNIRYLLEHDIHIWTEWAFEPYLKRSEQDIPEYGSPEYSELKKYFEQCILEDDAFAAQHGDLGPIYGVQWTAWTAPDGSKINQIERIVAEIKNNPDSRRLIVNAWNVGEIDEMALSPCHHSFQFYVADGKLSCLVNQRSADMFLGVPFNLASYALLTHMMAQQTGLEVGDLVWTGGDVHIYDNHVDQVTEQLSRGPIKLPTLSINGKPASIFEYKFEDFTIIGYEPHPAIKAPVAV